MSTGSFGNIKNIVNFVETIKLINIIGRNAHNIRYNLHYGRHNQIVYNTGHAIVKLNKKNESIRDVSNNKKY